MSSTNNILPVGYTVVFAPTDEQLLTHYLLPYNHHNTVPNCPEIQIQNIYSIPPDALLSDRPAAYFLASRPRKHRHRSRVSRDTGNGSSRKQGKVEQIMSDHDGRTVIGRKTQFYHAGFLLQEYELSADLAADADKVLCKVTRCNNKRKSSRPPETAPRPAKKMNYELNQEFLSNVEKFLNDDSYCMDYQEFGGSYCGQVSGQEQKLKTGCSGLVVESSASQCSDLQHLHNNNDDNNDDELSSASCTDDTSKLYAMTRNKSVLVPKQSGDHKHDKNQLSRSRRSEDNTKLQIRHSPAGPSTHNMVEEAGAVNSENELRRNWIWKLFSKFSWGWRKNE